MIETNGSPSPVTESVTIPFNTVSWALVTQTNNKDVSKKIELVVKDDKKNQVSPDFHFASAVAMYGQLLSDSDFKADASYEKVVALAKKGLNNDERGYRREFIRLVEAASGLTGRAED